MKGKAPDVVDETTATMHFMMLHRWFYRGQLRPFDYSERDVLCNEVLNARFGEMGQGLQPKLRYEAEDLGARTSYFPDDLAKSPQAIFACHAKLILVTARWKSTHEILTLLVGMEDTRPLHPEEQPRRGYSAFVPSAFDEAFDAGIDAAIESDQMPDGTDVHRLALMSTFPPRLLSPRSSAVNRECFEISRESLFAILKRGFQFSPQTMSFVSAD